MSYEISVSEAYGPKQGQALCETSFDDPEEAIRVYMEEVEKALQGWDYGQKEGAVLVIFAHCDGVSRRSIASATVQGREE